MKSRTMISIKAYENSVYLKTYSRDFRCSKNFCLLKKDVQKLISEEAIIVKDVCSFAELHCWKDVNHNRNVNIRFLWLENIRNGKYEGYDETICLPQEILYKALLESEYEHKLLSRTQAIPSKIEFHSRQNLKDIISQPIIRHKFVKFLEKNLNWKNYERFDLYDDFLPYSFMFDGYTSYGAGLSGGIILHGQDNLNTAYYSIHT